MTKLFNPISLLENLQRQILTIPQPPARWVVGFSGGLDSSVLLHGLVAALKLTTDTTPVVALHVNHGLSPEADRWQAQCEQFAKEQNVDFCAESVVVDRSGKGLEEAARDARYSVFERYLRSGDVLLLAHHMDDQAETMLFRLMRGTGPRGLAGMKPCRDLGEGYLLRPLLPFTRQQLLEYGQRNGLNWVEDHSNYDDAFDRNFIRNQIVPHLEQRWPGFQQRWLQSSQLCGDADELTQVLAAQDLAVCEPRVERVGVSLQVELIAQLPENQRNNLLRYWCLQQGASTPELKHLEQVSEQIFCGGSAGAVVKWGNSCLRAYGERLFLLPEEFAQPTESALNDVEWENIEEPVSFADGSRLEAHLVKSSGSGLSAVLVKSHPVTINWRLGGERCHPSSRTHSQTLKKLLQEFSCEPWLRGRVPLIRVGGEIAAVGDLWVNRDFAASDSELGWVLSWSYSDNL